MTAEQTTENPELQVPVRITRPPRPSDYGTPPVNWAALVIALVSTAAAVWAALVGVGVL